LKQLQKHENATHARLSKKNPDRIKKNITEVDKFIIKAKCVKVIPLDKNDRHILNDAIAVSRKIWNCCVNYVHLNKNPEISVNELRNLFVTKKQMSNAMIKELEWTFRISQKVREQTIRDFVARYNTSKSNFKKSQYKFIYKKNKKTKKAKKAKKAKKIKKKFTMRLRDKSAKRQTILISKERCIIKNNILHTINGVKLKLNESFPNGVPKTSIMLSRIGFEYFIYIPKYYSPKLNKKEAPDRIISVDPGNNILLTCYSPDGEWNEIGIGITDRLNKFYVKIKNLGLKLHGKIKFKAIRKIEANIKNMIDDIQWKVCHWLLSNYRKIIIPRLYVARCNKKVKQHQADLQHCRLIDRLCSKSIEYKNSEIHICKEHNTSKACTKCLSLNTTKGDVVKCKDCKNITHRDLNGARNIFLKHCF
jgi:transposase